MAGQRRGSRQEVADRFDDYVDVAERIRQFYDRYPDGSLVMVREPELIEVRIPAVQNEDGTERPSTFKSFIFVHARAFRHPDDKVPGDGFAWEPIPGPTPYTRDSELMNAQTAAWGRAIIACGFETKKIASRQEIEARSGGGQPSSDGRPAWNPPQDWPERAKRLQMRLGNDEAHHWIEQALYATYQIGKVADLAPEQQIDAARRLDVALRALDDADIDPLNLAHEIREPTQHAVAQGFDGMMFPGPPWRLDPTEESLPDKQTYLAAELAEALNEIDSDAAAEPTPEQETET